MAVLGKTIFTQRWEAKVMKVVKLGSIGGYDLCENRQDAKNSFCVGLSDSKGVYRQTSPWFVCRDYFSDLVAYSAFDKMPTIYGFKPDAYQWDGSGIIAYIGGFSRQDVYHKFNVINELLLSAGMEPIVVHDVKNKGYSSPSECVSDECGFDTNTENCDELYFIETSLFWRRSTFNLYLLSSLVRSVYWLCQLSTDNVFQFLDRNAMADLRAECQWVYFFHPAVVDIVAPIIRKDWDSCVSTQSAEIEDLIMMDGDYDNDYDYDSNDIESQIIDLLHDLGGTMSCSNVIASWDIFPERPKQYGNGKGHSLTTIWTGVNADIHRALVVALNEAFENGKITVLKEEDAA